MVRIHIAECTYILRVFLIYFLVLPMFIKCLLHTFFPTQVFKRGSKSEGATAAELGSEAIHRASQTLLSRVSMAALLAVVPDPVTCFKNSSFRQVGSRKSMVLQVVALLL